MPAAVRPFLVALTAAIALAGCGATDNDSAADLEGEDRLVANTIEDLSDAGREGDGAEICSLLSEALITKIRTAAGDGVRCEDAIEDAIDDADSFDIDVISVRVDGTAATAVVESKENDDEIRDTFGLVKEARRWKVNALSDAR